MSSMTLKLLTICSLWLLCASYNLRSWTVSTNSEHLPSGLLSRHQDKFKLPPGLAIFPSKSHKLGCECPEFTSPYLNHSYIAYEGSNHVENICKNLTEGILYRLADGGSIKKEGGRCIVKAVDTNVADMVLCGNWTVKEFKFSEKECTGSAAIEAHDGVNYFEHICYDLSKRQNYTSRTGGDGAFKTYFEPETGHFLCSYSAFIPEFPTDSYLCVVPQNFNVSVHPAVNENVCGEGKSLLNVLEVTPHLEEYCELLTDFSRAMLAGGGTLTRNDGNCLIVPAYPTHPPLENGLCANKNR